MASTIGDVPLQSSITYINDVSYRVIGSVFVFALMYVLRRSLRTEIAIPAGVTRTAHLFLKIMLIRHSLFQIRANHSSFGSSIWDDPEKPPVAYIFGGSAYAMLAM